MQVFNSVRKSFGNARKALLKNENYFSKEFVLAICGRGINPSDIAELRKVASFIDLSSFDSRVRMIQSQVAELTNLLKDPKRLPKPIEIMIDVFGFSRGAAQARVFTNKLFGMCSENELFGVPMQLRFLGLFETVASVNCPNTIGAHGHYGWSPTEDLKIDSRVKNWRHFVGLHEARASFPLDSAMSEDGYPPNGVEIVYPGAHSDIGGGYRPGEQGRGMRFNRGWEIDDASKFSQVTLNDMFEAAKAALVPWMSFKSDLGTNRKLTKTFAEDPSLRKALTSYFTHCGIASEMPLQYLIRQHQLLYLTWRYQVKRIFDTLPGTERAPANGKGFSGKEDLVIGNKVLIEQIVKLEGGGSRLENTLKYLMKVPAGAVAALAIGARDAIWDHLFVSDNARQILADVKGYRGRVPTVIGEFFDEYIHDSYAGFKLVDTPSVLEGQGYLHHRVVFAGKKKILHAKADDVVPANDENQSAVG